MPRPTNPVCSGSWPEPPPEITLTRGRGSSSARTTKLGSRFQRTMSRFARSSPSSACATRVPGSLRNWRGAAMGRSCIKRYTIRGTVTSPPPTKIIAVHLNYRSRAEQRGWVPDVPSYFMKPVSSLARSGDPVMRPRGTQLLRGEGEIAAIIGRRARHLTPEQGAAHVGWFAPANDVGLYDMRWADRGSNLFSKGQDGFTPIGTPIAADGIDPRSLTVRTRINGVIVQEDNSAQLIFP